MSTEQISPSQEQMPSYLRDEPPWVQEIHLYWFGPQSVYENAYEHRFALWYRGGPHIDQEIKQRFEGLLQNVAKAHQEGGWEEYKSSPRAALALVILLDQMSRNMYRGSAAMFATDPIARAIVHELLANGGYASLAPIERLFLCVALEHSEDVEEVRLSASLMEELSHFAPPPQAQRFVSMCKYNRQHLDIIEAFGRYPHRNDLLERHTTPEEADFLARKNYRFMRSVQKGFR